MKDLRLSTWLGCLLMTVGAVTLAVERQLFVDSDGNTQTDYLINGRGADHLCDVHGEYRETITPGALSEAGWGEPVRCWGEVYVDGELVDWFEPTCMGWECCQPDGPDLDGDGDVDLADFAVFVAVLSGPVETHRGGSIGPP